MVTTGTVATASSTVVRKAYLPSLSSVGLPATVARVGALPDKVPDSPILGAGGMTLNAGSSTVPGLTTGITSPKLGGVDVTADITTVKILP